MSKFLAAIVGLIAGYAVGALAGYAAIEMLSGNTHDKSMEAAMTAAFFTGPLGALIGAIVAAIRAKRTPPPSG